MMARRLGWALGHPWLLALAAIVVLAAAVRLWWVSYAQTEPVWPYDPWTYNRLAVSLAHGGGFVHENGDPTACCPPGYPGILAAVYWVVGDRPLAAELLNVAAGALSVALLYFIASSLFGRATGLVAALALAVFPSHILYTSQLHTEVVFTALLLGALCLLLLAGGGGRRPWVLLGLAGLVLGAATLVRPVALPLVAVAPLALRMSGASWGRCLRGGALVAVFALALVAPWVARNAVRVGVPAISTNVGINFWIGNHPDASGAFVMPPAYLFPRVSDFLTEQERQDYSRGLELGWRYLREEPLEALALLPLKLQKLYTDDAEAVTTAENWGDTAFLSEGGRRTLRLLTDGFYWFVAAGAVASLPRSGRRGWRTFALCFFAVWTATHLLFFTEARFHVPVTPLMAAMAAAGWLGVASVSRPYALMRAWLPRHADVARGTASQETTVMVHQLDHDPPPSSSR